MKKVWIFFQLRMLQLKSDKTALFFCYVFPVILLLGIGYPLQMQSDPKIELYYQDFVKSKESKAVIRALGDQSLVDIKEYGGDDSPYVAVVENKIKRFLTILSKDEEFNFDLLGVPIGPSIEDDSKSSVLSLNFSKNDIDENRIENSAIVSIINQVAGSNSTGQISQYVLKSDRLTSYLVTLLPGIIGLTLMIIGFNGFGSVLIEEEHYGLFKNIKTIDISPIPFLAGLLLSRLLICYSVAIGLCLVSVWVFGVEFKINILMFALIVTLGSISFLGIGLFLATISPSTTAFYGIVNFMQFPFVVLGGVFFSITLFPDWLQYLSLSIPLTQFNIAMKKVLFEPSSGMPLNGMYLEIGVMLAWCVASLFISRLRFRW